MKILVLSWRDIKNPEAGGAEIVIHEYLKRLSKNRHDCILFSQEFQNCKKIEFVEGYRIIRRGKNFLSTLFNAFIYCKRNKFNIIIDQITLLPFFTPLYLKKGNNITFIHDIGKEFWFYEFPFPIGLILYLAEKFYLRLYKNTKAITVSDSTRIELEKIGFRKISVINNGTNFKALKSIDFGKKERNLVMYVGRITKSKRIGHIIEAVSIVRGDIPDIKLLICGRVRDRNYFCFLKELAEKGSNKQHIRFYENLPSEQIREFLIKSELSIITSVQEGWGLTVIESNSCGTPVIGYDVRGLRDSIVDGETGLLVQSGNIEDLVASVIKVLKNKKLREKLSKNALKWSKKFDWDKSSKKFLKIIKVNT